MVQTFFQDSLQRMIGRSREDEAMAQAAKARDAGMAQQALGDGVNAFQNVQRMNMGVQQADADRGDMRARLAQQLAAQAAQSEAADWRAKEREQGIQDRLDQRLKAEMDMMDKRNAGAKAVATIRANAPARPRNGGVSSSADPLKMLVDVDKKLADLEAKAKAGYYKPGEMQNLLATRKLIEARINGGAAEERTRGSILPQPRRSALDVEP